MKSTAARISVLLLVAGLIGSTLTLDALAADDPPASQKVAQAAPPAAQGGQQGAASQGAAGGQAGAGAGGGISPAALGGAIVGVAGMTVWAISNNIEDKSTTSQHP